MHEGPSHPSTAQKAGSPEHGTVFRLSTGVRAHPDGVDNILVVIPTYNEAETIDLSGNDFGCGRELFGGFRALVGGAESGAHVFGALLDRQGV